tara:strand:- start:16920 stop:18077 length:1158 start_codon:yes stop_codon:yes gene_type:complete
MLRNKSIHWAFVLLAYFTLLCQSIIDNARGPVYPDILDFFNISSTRGAWVFALASLAGLASNITARWWLPRFEAFTSTIVSLGLMSIGSLIFSQSSQLGVWALDVASIIMGLGMGGANVSMNLLIARGTPLTHRRQFYSGLHSVYGLGSLSTPLLLNFYIGFGGSWHRFFLLLSILPFIILTTAIIRKNNFEHESTSPNRIRLKLTAPVALPIRLSYGFVFAFYVASEIVLSTRLVLYLTTLHSIDVSSARMALSFFFLSLLAGRLLFTVVPLKGASQRWLLVSCASTLVIYSLSQIISPLFLSLCGLSMSFFFPVAMDWLSKKFPQGLEWMTASVQTTVSLILVIMHIGFGYITDYFGINLAMGLIPIFQFLCMILLALLGKAS